MTSHISVLPAFLSRAIQALRDRIDRAHAPVHGLEAYLGTATSLHQLEDMQRRWDRNHCGAHSMGAY